MGDLKIKTACFHIELPKKTQADNLITLRTVHQAKLQA